MKVTVVEMEDGLDDGSPNLKTLESHLAREATDLLVLNELPFGNWPAGSSTFDAGEAASFTRLYDKHLKRLQNLHNGATLTTRARHGENTLVNEAVFLTEREVMPLHCKSRFPQEEGYFERSWFEPAQSPWRLAHAGEWRAGTLICTELMYTEFARKLASLGADVIAVPRATNGIENWLIAARMAAIVSGCYVASSNRTTGPKSALAFGGQGFVIAPDGQVVAITSAEEPVITVEMDLEKVRTAKKSYPSYIFEN